jgi:hypothetical protein
LSLQDNKMTPSPAEGIRVALINQFRQLQNSRKSPMTGPAALAAHKDISAGLLREREISRTPYFCMNATFAGVSETGKNMRAAGSWPGRADKKRLVTQ